MKKYYFRILMVVCMLNLAVGVSIAQVGNSSTLNATLHIIPNKTDNTTAEGIVAPNLTRAQLISKDAKYLAAQKGAVVYVTKLDGDITIKTAKVTAIGHYYFDGALWQNVGKTGTYFYLPIFSIPAASVGTGRTFDLYNSVFLKQFVQSGNTAYNTSNSALIKLPISSYTANELDYVVTYYDTDIIKINSVSASGVINYDVKSTILGPSSFINVVFITK